MADLFEDYKTRVCADWLNMVDWAVSDALGQPQSPSEALVNIGAKPDSPQDGAYYVAQNDSWVAVTPDYLAMPAYARAQATYTQQSGEDTFEIPGNDPRYVDVVLNGSLLTPSVDYTLGIDSIVLTKPIVSDSDTITVTAWGVVGTASQPYRTERVTLAQNEAVGVELMAENAIVEVIPQGSVVVAGSAFVEASASAQSVALIGGGADFETTTGPLDGTTGTDGKVTLSPADTQEVYFENRHSATLTVDITQRIG